MSEQVKKLPRAAAFTRISAPGEYNPSDQLNAGEFLLELRGLRGIKKYREMQDNSAVVGALMSALSLLMRAVDWHIERPDGATTDEGVDFLYDVQENMDHTWSDFISNAVSFVGYGFSSFEKVFKRRPDGMIGVKRLSPIAPWTVERFIVNDQGEIEALIQQSTAAQTRAVVPFGKLVHFRTPSINDDPSGRSVLRSAYLSYHYVSHLEMIEAIAIERELNGLPLFRLPSSYLADDAPPAQKQFLAQLETIGRRLHRNEQSYIILPSDRYKDGDGNPTGEFQVDFSLVASSGSRDVDVSASIQRHNGDIARTVLADFIMLGQSERGSFALSKSKTDLFLRAVEAFLNSMADTLNRSYVPSVWAMNGLPPETMPHYRPGNVAPVDLAELGEYISKLAGAGASLFPDEELDAHLRDVAGLPEASLDGMEFDL